MWSSAIVALALALLMSTGAANEAATEDLLQAAVAGGVADIEAALQDGAAIDGLDPDGNTPLLLAVMHNTADVVEALLDAGADAQYLNPQTGMGVFAVVWRNPNSSAVASVLRERGLFPVVGPRASEPGGQPEPPTAPTTAAPAAPTSDHDDWRGLSRNLPFDIREVESGWTESGSYYVPYVTFSIQSATGASVPWLTIRAEFFVPDSIGELMRLGGGVFDVVGVTDVPLRGDARRYVWLESDQGFGERRSPPVAIADLYYRAEQGGDWVQFRRLDVNPAYR